MKRDFLKLLDYSTQEITDLIDLAIKMKKELKSGVKHTFLQGKTVALIFEKSSTRTRVSFEVGINQMGGYPLFLSSNDIQLGRGESIEDTAKVLSRYVDCIMIRTFSQDRVELMAKHATVPVINGLTDQYHPCQIMADLMTVKEYKGHLAGLNVAFIGDGNNVANSYIVGALKVGMNVTIACPESYEPHADVLKFAQQYKNFRIVRSPLEAAKDADVVVTDVYVSMGQEADKLKREAAFKGFIVDQAILDVAHKDCMVQHCLPAHKGEEISQDIFDKHSQEIFDEAENRLHAQKAIIATLLS